MKFSFEGFVGVNGPHVMINGHYDEVRACYLPKGKGNRVYIWLGHDKEDASDAPVFAECFPPV